MGMNPLVPIAIKYVLPVVTSILPVDKVLSGPRTRIRARDHARTLHDGHYMEVFLGTQEPRRHWVVWSGSKPVAAHPSFSGDLAAALVHLDTSQRTRARK